MTEGLRNRAGAVRDYAALLNLTHDSIFVRDMTGRILFWNRGAEETYGWSEREALGEVVYVLLATEFPKPLEQIEADLLATGRWEGELVHRKRDGTHIVVASRWALQRDAQGAPVEILETNKDITPRKRAEDVLRDSEQRYRAVIETAHEAFIAMDASGRIIDWNHQAELTFGWPREEAIGRPLAEMIIPPQYRESHRRGLQHFLATRQGPVLNKRIELTALHRDGHEFPVELTIAAIRLGPTYIFNSFLHDITARKQAEDALRRQKAELTRSNAELAAANKELEAFTYSVSHDLRAPLRHIAGFSRILAEEFGPRADSRAQRCLERVHKGVQEMGQLIDDLLNLGRVGRRPLKEQPTELNSLVAAVLADLKPETEKRRIEWQIEPLPSVKCDPGLVKLVFANLLSNAVKFTRHQERAMIQVGRMSVHGEQVFFVRDNGIGFNMRYANKLFGIFQRLHREEDFEGTGVGLANVRRIVHKHGGRVWAEAEPYKGAAFYFTLGISQETGPESKSVAVTGA